MSKCNRIGCDKAGFLAKVPIFGGAFFADAYFCAEHFKDGVESILE